MKKSTPIQYGLFLMRVALVHMLVTFFTLTLAHALESNGQGVLDRKITIVVENEEVRQVLILLGRQANVKFTYSPTLIPVSKRVSLHLEDTKLADVLHDLLSADISYKVIGKQIALKPLEQTAYQIKIQDLANPGSYAEFQIAGKVTDKTGAPLPGVNIIVKGTTVGTTTDATGLYKLAVPDGNATLLFSFIGYTTQEFVVNNQSIIDVTLLEDIQSLAEVVVVGYGTQEKREVSSAISQVKGEELLKSTALSISNSLAGRVPGLLVNQRNGEPGNDDATIYIRGKGTTGNAAPLIVVDGVANREGNNISRIDPHDIESITVLKDASAAIYGAQSANGVILITTKRGKVGKPTINYSFNQGFVSPTRVVKMTDASLFTRSVNAISGGGVYSDQTISQYDNGQLPSTDWVKETIKPYALQDRHSLTLSGGTEAVKYFLSSGVAYQNGIVKNDNRTSFRQYNFRANIDAQVSKRLGIGFDLTGRRENRNYLSQDQNTLWSAALLAQPVVPATIDGYPAAGRFQNNPLAIAQGPGYNNLERNVFYGTVKANYKLPYIDGLTTDGFAAYDFRQDFQALFQYPHTYYQKDASGNTVPVTATNVTPSLREDFVRNQSMTLNAKLKYDKVIGIHSISAFVAYEQNQFKYDTLVGSRTGYKSSRVDQLFAGTTANQTNYGSAYKTARQNYFGRVSYTLRDKYMAQFNFRYDGTNNFPSNTRFGFFPGVSAGWRISEESFLKGNPVVSNLKLRASWGQLGNDKVPQFQYLSLFNYATPGNGYVINGQDAGVLNSGVSPNPNITWERKKVTDIGLEAAFFENRLTLEADYFHEDRSNILTAPSASIPDYTGLQLPNQNIGKVTNGGFDASILYRNRVGGISYNVGGNVTYARNKVVYIGESPTVPSYQKIEGKPLGDLSTASNDLTYQVIGMYRTQEDILRYPNNDYYGTPKLGDLIYADQNGDGKIGSADRFRSTTTSTPRLQYGINLGAQYKGFDLGIFFQGQALASQYLTYNFSQASNGIEYFLKNAWNAETPNAPLPAINRNQERNTLWVRNVSFLRLKNMEVGYTLPKNLIHRIGIQALRVYANGFNLLTFDPLKKDKLPDPENINIQSWRYPQTKSINFGLTVTF